MCFFAHTVTEKAHKSVSLWGTVLLTAAGLQACLRPQLGTLLTAPQAECLVSARGAQIPRSAGTWSPWVLSELWGVLKGARIPFMSLHRRRVQPAALDGVEGSPAGTLRAWRGLSASCFVLLPFVFLVRQLPLV